MNRLFQAFQPACARGGLQWSDDGEGFVFDIVASIIGTGTNTLHSFGSSPPCPSEASFRNSDDLSPQTIIAGSGVGSFLRQWAGEPRCLPGRGAWRWIFRRTVERILRDLKVQSTARKRDRNGMMNDNSNFNFNDKTSEWSIGR